MTTPRCTLVEVASNLACAGGSPLGPIVDVGQDEEVRSVVGEETLTIDLPRSSLAWAHLRERRILRTQFDDGSFDEWRITTLTEERQGGAVRSSVKAVWPVVDLGTVLVARTEANGLVRHRFDAPELTIAELLTQYLLASLADAGLTWWTTGQIDSSASFPMTFSGTSVLEACRQLAVAAKLEFRVRRNGTTNYLLDFLTQIGGTTDPQYTPGGAPRLYVQYSKNLLGMRRQRTSDGQRTRCYPFGAEVDGIPATIAEAVWEVTATPTGSTFRLADPTGGDPPIAFDDQLGGAAFGNTLWVRHWPSGSWVQVTDSAVLNQECTTSGAHGLTTGDLVQFALSSTGKELTYLESPADRTLYGILSQPLTRPDIAGTLNLIPNAAQRAFATGANGPADGWNIIPGCGLAAANVDKETTRFRTGGASTRLVTAADGQGIESPYGAGTPTDPRPYVSGLGVFWNDTDGARIRAQLVLGAATVAVSSMSRSTIGGKVVVVVNTSAAHGRAIGDLVELLGVTGGTTPDGYNGIQRVSAVVDADTLQVQLTADPGAITLTSATLRPVWVFKTPGTAATKNWDELGYENVNAKTLGAIVFKVQLCQDGATGATWYVDAAQVTQTAAQVAFIDGNGANQLWQAANRALALEAPPGVEYDIDVADLARYDRLTYPNTDIVPGGLTTVNDPDLGEIANRVVERRRRLLQATVAKVLVSNRLEDIADLVARPTVPPRKDPSTPAARRKVVPVPVQAAAFVPKSAADAANLVYNFAGAPAAEGLYPINGATALASADVTKDLPRGGTIVGLYSDLQQLTAGAGTVKLYRDGTVIATLTATNTDLTQADMTVRQLVGAQNFWLEVSLQQVSSTIFAFLKQVTLLVEVDEEDAQAR